MVWFANAEMYPEVIIKLSVALLLSLIIGVEREIKKKPIGLKTSAIIATFSCLLTIVSIESAYLVPARDDINVSMDPLRLAAQVVSGIGFLGAGAILRRDNDSITGLTTAAMIWGSASIGISVGAGFYIEAAFAVCSVIFVIGFLAPALIKYGPKKLRAKEIPCTLIIDDKSNIDELIAFFKSKTLKIEHLNIRQLTKGVHSNKHQLEFRLSTVANKKTSQLYDDLTSLPYVEAVQIEIIL